MTQPTPAFKNLIRRLDQANLTGKTKTRFAPSPTGHLHLGHLASAIYVWGVAGRLGLKVELRIEDHDTGRSRPEHLESILRDLKNFGFFKAGDTYSTQSNNLARYKSALSKLESKALTYFCTCTRRIIKERDGTSKNGELQYSNFCRNLAHSAGPDCGLRFALPDTKVNIEDVALGSIQQHPIKEGGDFLLVDRHQDFTYLLTCTVDDLVDEIDLVIRGEDILNQTGRQILLWQALSQNPPPRTLHHPLILDPNTQKKLSKRDLSASLFAALQNGATVEQLIGEAACRAGILRENKPMGLEQVLDLFL